MNVNDYVTSMLKSTRESTVGLEMDLRFDIIEFIKQALRDNNMTQNMLALKMGMKDSQLTRILNAESNMTLETIARIYHAFGRRPKIDERHDASDAVGEKRIYKNAVISEPGNKFSIASIK